MAGAIGLMVDYKSDATNDVMNAKTRERLLALNRDFYATIAAPFHETRKARSSGKSRLLEWLPDPAERPLRILDAGCGNGRFARTLATMGRPVDYVGVDGDATLLAFAEEHTTGLAEVTRLFAKADLADAGWTARLANQGIAEATSFDVAVCLATLQHMPGRELRARLIADLADCVTRDGLVIVSAWQFLDSPRLAGRRLAWSDVGLSAEDVEPGDALLPWKQGSYAIRYVHQTDPVEMADLATGANLTVKGSFRADGREGNLNYYAIMQKREDVNG